MKSFFKIFIVVTLFSILFITNVNASGVLMNLENHSQNLTNTAETEYNIDANFINNYIQDESENELLDEEENITESEVKDENNSPRVTSSKDTSDNEFLTTENILSIILIVIGILLIFLAVAILIRFK